MNKSKKWVVKIFLYLVLIVIVGVGIFYYRIGIGFGEAVSKTAIGLKEAQSEWKKRDINPLDSLKEEIYSVLDTTKLDSVSNFK